MTSSRGALDERTILVPGGTGNVGEGVVRSLLKAGAAVVVPSRSAERLEALRDLIGPGHANRLIGISAPYDTFEAADGLAETVRTEAGTITDVVALIGGWWAGKPLWEISAADWQRVFISPATTQAALVRAFLPGLDGGGSYTAVAGFSAQVPTAGSGPVSMQGAAQLMMRRVLSEEISSGPRINDVMLGPIVNRSRPQGRADWLTADEVGEVVARIVADRSVRDTLVDVQDRKTFNAFLQS
jgi:NAD(P)-dependent dehydrogenase (short-subunit alcohol dehydrogenase family)